MSGSVEFTSNKNSDGKTSQGWAGRVVADVEKMVDVPAEFVRRGVHREERRNLAKVDRDNMREQRRQAFETAQKVIQIAAELASDSSDDEKEPTKWNVQLKHHVEKRRVPTKELTHETALLQEQMQTLAISTETLERVADSNLRHDAKEKSGWSWWR